MENLIVITMFFFLHSICLPIVVSSVTILSVTMPHVWGKIRRSGILASDYENRRGH